MTETEHPEIERFPGVWIDDEWRQGDGRPSITLIDPATERPWAEVELATAEDADRAVRSAADALPAWAATPLEERKRIVARIADLMDERAPELARLRSLSIGAPYQSSLKLSNSVGLIRSYLELVDEVDFQQVRRDANGDTLVTRTPVGVVAGIVPWNVPVRNELKKTIPAILCGCTVVLKPALESPVAGGAMMRLFADAGLPAGVVNMVVGGGDIGEALVGHPLVRKIAFTGSTATGSRIAALAAPQMKRLQMELGGKSAAVVLDDADLDRVVPSLLAFGFGNSGQICASLTRVVVPRALQEDLVGRLAEGAAKLRLGDPMDPATTHGPLVSKAQRDKVLGYIAQGREEGARLVVGGGTPAGLDRGYYVEPTVFADVDNDMTIAREEIFGPVISVIPYDGGEDEAVAIANDSQYGLHGAVYSRDDERALRVAEALDTGTVAINSFDVPITAPFGGVKMSGFGRENGVEGFDSFLEYHSYKLTPELAEKLSPNA